MKEAICGNAEARGGTNVVVYALRKYAKNFRNDMFADMSIWVPSHFINFTFMPMHMRIPWVASTSFFYSVVLSYMRGGHDDEAHPAAQRLTMLMPKVTDDELTRLIRATVDKFINAKTRLLPNAALVHALRELGVDDDVGSHAVAELCDWGRSDALTQMEFVATMLALAGPTRTVEQRLAAIFTVCDFAEQQYLTRTEVNDMVRSLISMRETLTIGSPCESARARPHLSAVRARARASRVASRADAAAYEWNFSYAYTSDGVDPVPTRKRKNARAAALRKAHPEYAGLADLSSILDLEAAQLTAAIFNELGSGRDDGHGNWFVSKQQVMQWAGKESETSKRLFRLNEVFAKAAERASEKKPA